MAYIHPRVAIPSITPICQVPHELRVVINLTNSNYPPIYFDYQWQTITEGAIYDELIKMVKSSDKLKEQIRQKMQTSRNYIHESHMTALQKLVS